MSPIKILQDRRSSRGFPLFFEKKLQSHFNRDLILFHDKKASKSKNRINGTATQELVRTLQSMEVTRKPVSDHVLPKTGCSATETLGILDVEI